MITYGWTVMGCGRYFQVCTTLLHLDPLDPFADCGRIWGWIVRYPKRSDGSICVDSQCWYNYCLVVTPLVVMTTVFEDEHWFARGACNIEMLSIGSACTGLANGVTSLAKSVELALAVHDTLPLADQLYPASCIHHTPTNNGNCWISHWLTAQGKRQTFKIWSVNDTI